VSLEELKQQATQLPAPERLELVSALIRSLQGISSDGDWQFLLARPHPWRKQLFIKGRKLLAATVWRDMVANQMSPEQAAENWNLPLAAIQEVVQYCETHQDLLKLEAEEERYLLQESGFSVETGSAA
jgi:uncharacterized protein (DUF433 family)